MLNTPLKYEIYRQTALFLIGTSVTAPIGFAISWLPWAAGGINWYSYLAGGVGFCCADLLMWKPWKTRRIEFNDYGEHR
jgi:hypothetical protein